jgi:hypothetical protein
VRQNGAFVNQENAKDFRPFCFSGECAKMPAFAVRELQMISAPSVLCGKKKKGQ